jgi:hypothetical protein
VLIGHFVPAYWTWPILRLSNLCTNLSLAGAVAAMDFLFCSNGHRIFRPLALVALILSMGWLTKAKINRVQLTKHNYDHEHGQEAPFLFKTRGRFVSQIVDTIPPHHWFALCSSLRDADVSFALQISKTLTPSALKIFRTLTRGWHKLS